MRERDDQFAGLLGAAKAGEERALTALWSRYEPAVRGAVRRRLSPDLRRLCDTVDVTQSVFRALLRDLPRLRDQGEDAFRHLLYLKAESKVWQLRRRIGRANRALAGAPRGLGSERETGSVVARREDAERARRALASLDGVSAQVVRLKAIDGQSFAAIARVLGLAGADAARKRFARGILRLQKALAGPGS